MRVGVRPRAAQVLLRSDTLVFFWVEPKVSQTKSASFEVAGGCSLCRCKPIAKNLVPPSLLIIIINPYPLPPPSSCNQRRMFMNGWSLSTQNLDLIYDEITSSCVTEYPRLRHWLSQITHLLSRISSLIIPDYVNDHPELRSWLSQIRLLIILNYVTVYSRLRHWFLYWITSLNPHWLFWIASLINLYTSLIDLDTSLFIPDYVIDFPELRHCLSLITLLISCRISSLIILNYVID